MSRGQAGDETASPTPDELFSLLGNEVRMGILRALWDEYYLYAGPESTPFSTLYERVDIDDTGNFNYHLDELTGHLVRQTDDGYRLTPAGFRIVNAIAHPATTEKQHVERARVDLSCPRCAAPVAVASEDETMWMLCTECEGYYDDVDGGIAGFQLPPGNVRDRSPLEILGTSMAYTVGRGNVMLVDGICPDCGGDADSMLSVCEDHDADGDLCTACGRSFLGMYTFVCTTCRNAIIAPSWAPVNVHPALMGFYDDRGIEHRPNALESLYRAYTWTEELASADPPRVRITVEEGGDRLSAVVDEAAAVVEVTR